MAAPAFCNHIGLCVTDLDRSRRFYEELFGCTVQRELKIPDGPAAKLLRIPAPVGMTSLYLQLGTTVLQLVHFDRPGNDPRRDRGFTEPGLTHLSISVADHAATIARVAELGGTVLEDTLLVGIAVMIQDPDGQLIEVLPANGVRG